MRIRTDGVYGHRVDTIEAAMETLDESSKTAAVLAACEHALQARKTKRKALAHPVMTPELAEVLSTPRLARSYDTPGINQDDQHLRQTPAK